MYIVYNILVDNDVSYSDALEDANCCEKVCKGGSGEVRKKTKKVKYYAFLKYFQASCCKPGEPCGLYGGDCDKDEDCAGDLVCGDNNCPDFWPDAISSYDCCVPP